MFVTTQAEDARPHMDLFKAIFASDDSDLSESEGGTESLASRPNSTSASFSLPPLCEPQCQSLKKSKEPAISHNKQWQDLSVVSSYVEQSKGVQIPPLPLPSKHQTSTDSNTITSKEKLKLVLANNESIKKNVSDCALYGPSLPPGIIIYTCIVIVHNVQYKVRK